MNSCERSPPLISPVSARIGIALRPIRAFNTATRAAHGAATVGTLIAADALRRALGSISAWPRTIRPSSRLGCGRRRRCRRRQGDRAHLARQAASDGGDRGGRRAQIRREVHRRSEQSSGLRADPRASACAERPQNRLIAAGHHGHSASHAAAPMPMLISLVGKQGGSAALDFVEARVVRNLITTAARSSQQPLCRPVSAPTRHSILGRGPFIHERSRMPTTRRKRRP